MDLDQLVAAWNALPRVNRFAPPACCDRACGVCGGVYIGECGCSHHTGER